MQRIGRYTIVGPHARGQDPDYKVLVLDANVLIDIRNFYFGVGPSEKDSLQQLLLRYPKSRRDFIDINFGWATSELSWTRGTGHDPVRHRRLVHAGSQVLSWDAERIEKEFARNRPPVDRDRYWPRRVAIRADQDAVDPRVLVLAPYGALLYLLALEKRREERKSRGRAWALMNFASWMRDTLGVIASYPMSLAIGLLAGNAQSQQQARAVLKLSGSETVDKLAAQAWNVAWDITMTSLGEGISYGLLPGVVPAASALVTRDSDPWILRSASELRLLIDVGREKFPMTAFGMDLHPSVPSSVLEDLFRFDPISSLGRFERDPEAVVRQAAAAVDGLERELKLTRRTMHDSWML
jgi:hypothetical protein